MIREENMEKIKARKEINVELCIAERQRHLGFNFASI